MMNPSVNKMIVAAAVVLPLVSCAHVSVEPVEVKPIHITADINLNVKIDRELDDFFAFQKNYEPATQSTGATSATAPSAAQ